MPGPTVLIIDDEESIRKTLAGVLADDGYETATAASGQEGLDILQEAQPAIVMLDISMEPGMDGIETLRRIKEIRPELPVIMVTGHGDIETAVKTTKMGAYDFIEKPPALEHLRSSVKHGLDDTQLREENESLRKSIERRYEIVGESATITALKAPDLARRTYERLGADPRRERDGQGAGGARHPPRKQTRDRAFCGGELRRDPAGAHRERALRP